MLKFIGLKYRGSEHKQSLLTLYNNTDIEDRALRSSQCVLLGQINQLKSTFNMR